MFSRVSESTGKIKSVRGEKRVVGSLVFDEFLESISVVVSEKE